ncbi:hypothetical protein HL658_31290 [Azospirillum sp. RWY-5-1]|uniref:Uncharacterized protein n=1 Tax=Azospirillum oleiclasticum TaxID=2735135 RepID=A0ABX2TJI1_9PROT|nr:hypothetical protein [Azospirillum oleiclasticum]NYZ17050.1 hypothetical protein [Azospirillum oleiclasticum]NYZ24506.1 hypothetical protein [Azospirillum oleiclasticum]
MGFAHAFAALLLCVIFSGGLYLLKRPSSDLSDRIVGLVAVLLSVAGMLAVGGAAALAADLSVAPPSPWSGVLETAVGSLAAIASATILAVFELARRQLKARLGVALDDQAREYVQDAADRFAAFAHARLSALAGLPAPSPVGLPPGTAPGASAAPALYDSVVDEMVDAMVEQVPDGLSRLGVDAAGVRRMLMVRLAARGILPEGG